MAKTLVATGGILAASAAAAQAPTAEVPAGRTPTAATEASGDTPGGVGDIIVTAQRRSERLSQVPISITALNGEGLKSSGVEDVRALIQVTPGLNFQAAGSSGQPLIRGIGSSGAAIGDSSNVALYVDGVYQPFQAANFLRFEDVDRIEVLKGPQGTLFGRNAAGGAISITTLDPKLDTATGRLRASYSRFDELQLNGFVSVPVASNVAASLAANYIHNDGFRRDLFLDKTLGYLRYYDFRGKLLFEPGGRTRILLTGHYRRTNDLNNFGPQPLDGDTSVRALVPTIQLPTKPNTTALNLVPTNRIKYYGANLKIDQDLGFATLASLTAFSIGRQFVFTDSDLTPAAFAQSRIPFGTDMVSQDLTLASNGDGRISWLLGGTYYHETGFIRTANFSGLLVAGTPPLTSGTDIATRINAFAVFGEATYRITDALTVIAGLRFSHDLPSFRGSRIVAATGLSNPATFVNPHDSFSKATPRVAVRYALTPAINAYASYTRGFKSGVFNSNNLQVAAVKPETVDSYEVGMKGAASQHFSFDLAAYYYDYKNLQIQSFGATSTSPILRNAASAEIYGFEANATLVVARGLTLRGGGAYTNGKYTDFPGAQGNRLTTNAAGVPIGGNTSFIFDASGQRLIRTPRVQFNGTIAYQTEIANGGKADVNLTGSHNSRIVHDVAGNFSQPAFTVVNANIGYATPDDHWRASLFGTNIFNEKYVLGILITGLATAVTYARPATYGARIEYRF